MAYLHRILFGMDVMPFASISADPLGESLHFLRMSGTFYSRCELTAPWGLVLPAFGNSLIFHVVTSGRCVLEVDDAEPCVLQPGELVLVPHGEGHRLASELGVPGVGLFDLPHEQVSPRYDLLRIDGGGAEVRLICGVIRFDHPAGRHLIDLLPRVIHVDTANSLQKEWMHSTLRIMAAEARELRPGGEAVITRLADILVIQAIRSWIDQDSAAKSGWLGALRDPQIGRAITLIHGDPARAWTVQRLASEVTMSRSAFAARFTELVEETPMRYVARWRMYAAMNQLREDQTTVSEAAVRAGYQSEAAFSRAFKRLMGISPGTVRRNGDAGSGPATSGPPATAATGA